MPQGLVDTYKTVTALGIPANTTFQFDGAGSDERSRTSPGAMAAFLRGVSTAPWAKAFEDSLPILGVDGTLGNNQAGTPAAGHVFAKTGTRAATTVVDTGILTGLTQVGYVETASGRRLTYGIMTEDVPFTKIETIFTASDDQGDRGRDLQRVLSRHPVPGRVSSSQSRITRLANDRLKISQWSPAPSAFVKWTNCLRPGNTS